MIKDYFKNSKGAWELRQWPEYSCNFQTGEIIGPDGRPLPVFKDKQVKERAQRYCVSLPVSWDNGVCIRTAFKQVFVHRLILFSSPGFVFHEGYVIHHKNGDHFDNRLANLDYLTPSEHNHQTAMTQELWQDKRSKSLKRTMNSPEYKEAHRRQYAEWTDKMKKFWETHHDQMVARCHSPEADEKRRRKNLQNWSDPEKRARWLEAMRSPEARQNRAKMSGEMWAARDDEAKAEIGRKISEAKMGHQVSEQTRRKISQKCKGKPSPAKGKLWFTDGVSNILADKCPEGFRRGMTKKREDRPL